MVAQFCFLSLYLCSVCILVNLEDNQKILPAKQDLSMISLNDLNALKVTNVDELYNRNTSEHYTQLYEFDDLKRGSGRFLSRLTSSDRETKRRPLILRRGQAFELRISFNREFRKGDDLINLVFSLNGRGAEPPICDRRSPYSNSIRPIIIIYESL